MSSLSDNIAPVYPRPPPLHGAHSASSNSNMVSINSEIVELRIENSRRLATLLPDELLSQIFESACLITIPSRSDPSLAVLASASRRTVLNAILATCFRWREVGLATTSLWESVLVTDPNYLAVDKKSGRIPMMTGIERAGTRALSLYVSSTLHPYYWEILHTLLHPYAHRFRQIFASQKHYSHDFGLLIDLRSNEEPLPLRTLVLIWRQSRSLHPEIFDLTRATALRYLQLDIVYGRGHLVTIQPPPSSELTHIRLSSRIDPSDVIRVIESTRSLQALRWGFSGEQTLSIDSIKFQPYLQYLSLTGALPTRLLVGLEASRLNTLQIDLFDASPSVFSHITTRAFPNLRTLHVSFGGFVLTWENSPHQAILSSILSDCPHLERITLPYILDDELVTFLASDSLPPKIKDVWVFIDHEVHLTARELLQAWSIQEGRKDIVLHVQSIAGKQALLEEQMRELVPTYGGRVAVGEVYDEYDRVWTVETYM